MFDRSKKVLAAVAGLAALALGGAAFANAQSGSSSGTATSSAPRDGHDGEASVTGPAADKAKAAALAKVPGGTVTRVDQEGAGDKADATDAGEKADANDPADTPDAGDKADANDPADTPDANDTADGKDPADNPAAAWKVEVSKSDGSSVDVVEDASFTVLSVTPDARD